VHRHKWSFNRFVYGALGALAPEVVRIRQASDLSLIHSSPYLIVISIVFVLLGGVFADAWEEAHPIKCLYIGRHLPHLVDGLGACAIAGGVQVASMPIGPDA
jgi:hypothetical protein